MKEVKENISFEEQIREGLKLTKEKLLEFKRQKNSPLIICKDGEIVEVSPEKLK